MSRRWHGPGHSGTSPYAADVTVPSTADGVLAATVHEGTQRRTVRTMVENRLPVRLRRAQAFRAAHGRYPRLSSPETFSEKMNWRILRDRRELLRSSCDKLAMKDLARRCGADVRVPEVLWTGTDVTTLGQVALPAAWVLKPNHRANGLVLFGTGPDVDPGQLAARTRGWLELGTHASVLGEWAYTQARRCLLVEERVPGQPLPLDYKVLVFDGEPALVEVHGDRFGQPSRQFYRPDWSPAGAADDAPVPAPARLDQLLRVAAAIAAGFDFLRVDLYATPAAVWFGEVTPYAGSGLSGALGPALERELGARWQLPARARTGRQPVTVS